MAKSKEGVDVIVNVEEKSRPKKKEIKIKKQKGKREKGVWRKIQEECLGVKWKRVFGRIVGRVMLFFFFGEW